MCWLLWKPSSVPFFNVQIIKEAMALLGEWEWGTTTVEDTALLMVWEVTVSLYCGTIFPLKYNYCNVHGRLMVVLNVFLRSWWWRQWRLLWARWNEWRWMAWDVLKTPPTYKS